VSAGAYTTVAASPALATGSYVAVARQPSSIGNPEGVSETRAFEVNTEPPAVTLEPLPARSNNRTPTFSGTVSGKEAKTETVTVHVFDSEEHEVASATATPAAGKWTTKALSPALAEGANAYTAVATEPSSLGNAEGRSAKIPFTIDTKPPTVTLEEVAAASNNNTPTFTGTASDSGPVTVEIVGGKAPVKATAAVVEGKWSTGPVTLAAAKAEYVATASQASSIGNPTGKSKPIRFIVDPAAPSVFMTPPKALTNTPTPTFTGTAGSTPVTVSICKLTTPCAAEQGEWTAKSAGGGAWSATLTTPLADGQYQAIASERSVTNTLGATERQLFTIDTVAPVVTVNAPAQGATVIGGSVSAQGTAATAAHDGKEVTVELFEGSAIAPGSSPVQGVKVPIGNGAWSATLGGLKPGPYTLRASQADDAGNAGVSTHSFTDASPGVPAAGPTASFNWFPTHPHVGETVTLVSTSTDSASPITGYAWNLLGSAFTGGGQKQTTSFAAPGNHAIGLRVTDGAGLSALATQQIPVSFPLMRPFPVVRIVTTRAAGRIRLKLLGVEAPAGATVTITCKGKGCPVRSLSHVLSKPKAKGKTAGTPTLSFARLQRVLRPGIVLEIRITTAGQVGKFTRLTIRKGKLPLRADACVNGKEPRPVPCAS
jgi:hypothetical protein